jgi:exopolysaccharide biosynthesis polyprenyl glycosylphosphotransferase
VHVRAISLEQSYRRKALFVGNLTALSLSLCIGALVARSHWSMGLARIAFLAGGSISFAALQVMLSRASLFSSRNHLARKIALAQLLVAAITTVPLLLLDPSFRWLIAFYTALALGSWLVLAFRRLLASLSLPHCLFTLRPINLVIWGTSKNAKFLVRHFSTLDRYCRVVGCQLGAAYRTHSHGSVCSELGTVEQARDFLFRNPVDMVITADHDADKNEVYEIAQSALELGVRFAAFDHQYDFPIVNGFQVWSETSRFLDIPLIVYSSVPWRRGYLVVKRCVDILAASIALVCLSPLLLLITVLIKITSPGGPVLFRLLQAGLNRRPIVCYKFRTMVPNAEALQKELMSQNEMQGPVFKIRDDPRITRLGRLLRRSSLDELPQIFSVLKGDLSIVGPRAPLRTEVDKFAYWHRCKLAVKPGLTCFWQIGGRSRITNFDEWILLDLKYIQRASLYTDLKILMKTIPVVLFGVGAY